MEILFRRASYYTYKVACMGSVFDFLLTSETLMFWWMC
jgi:hypothetical protein